MSANHSRQQNIWIMFGGDRPKTGKIKKYSSINIVFVNNVSCLQYTRSKVKNSREKRSWAVIVECKNCKSLYVTLIIVPEVLRRTTVLLVISD